MSFEMALTNIFTEMGTLFARYPIPVIFLSIGFAVGLSTGILWLDVTTDPIELWASPESRSRVEKDFFDSTFRPFYRTEQIIIKAKNLEPVNNYFLRENYYAHWVKNSHVSNIIIQEIHIFKIIFLAKFTFSK